MKKLIQIVTNVTHKVIRYINKPLYNSIKTLLKKI